LGLSIVSNGIVCMRGSDAALPKLLWGGLGLHIVKIMLVVHCYSEKVRAKYQRCS